jgi:3-deoxy-D-manno-octulosonate 8-phosphate phosphatase (KDO 8-P phosphatase)
MAFGLQMAMKHGYRVLIVSGGVSEESRRRLEYLGIKDIHLGVADKINFVADLLKSNKIKWEEVLYMGDDPA